MAKRCTVRLPDDLWTRLQIAADRRKCGLSDVIRLALAGFVEAQGADGPGAPPVRADSPAPAPQDRETARPPEQPSPQVVGAARRLRAMPPWKVFRRGSQDSGTLIPTPGAPSLPGPAASASTPAAPSGG